MSKDQISVTYAAKGLGVTRQRVLALVTSGKIKAEKIGNSWVLDRKSVEEYKKRQG